MDASITYSQAPATVDIPENQLPQMSTGHLNSLLHTNPIFYQQTPTAYNHHLFMNQYKNFFSRNHQDPSTAINTSSVSSSTTSTSSSTSSMPPFHPSFLSNTQQHSLLNQANFASSHFGTSCSSALMTPSSAGLYDESNLYNRGFNSALVGHIASKSLNII